MIRFIPDTWREALLRPIAMAAPDGAVYVEIIAPDFRFLFALTLALGWLVLARRRLQDGKAAALLGLLTMLAFIPWLATTGNGRYFVAFLLLVGPLCVGLAYRLPLTRSFRLTLVLAMVAWQAYLVLDVRPWRSWGLIAWEERPAMELELPPDVMTRPATYVTVSNISYSIIAPLFPPQSRWINIASLPGGDDPSMVGRRARELLAGSETLRLIFPSLKPVSTGDPLDPVLVDVIDDLVAPHGLSIRSAGECQFLPSRSISAHEVHKVSGSDGGERARQGFWMCPLDRQLSRARRAADMVPEDVLEVFRKLEDTCPRLFRRVDAGTLRIPSGTVRTYPGSDSKIYVLDDGTVLFKYLRSLNAERIGSVADVVSGKVRFDCNNIRGRTGLPWERQI